MKILAIDPGPDKSALVLYNATTSKIEFSIIEPNCDLACEIGDAGESGPLRDIDPDAVPLVIEMIASYGMAVGREVFETCVWIGRFIERYPTMSENRLFRRDVKLHLCGNNRANDSNIRQALIDRFGPGKEKAIGRKASPGPLYGIAGDVWSALAVAVTFADQQAERKTA